MIIVTTHDRDQLDDFLNLITDKPVVIVSGVELGKT